MRAPCGDCGHDRSAHGQTEAGCQWIPKKGSPICLCQQFIPPPSLPGEQPGGESRSVFSRGEGIFCAKCGVELKAHGSYRETGHGFDFKAPSLPGEQPGGEALAGWIKAEHEPWGDVYGDVHCKAHGLQADYVQHLAEALAAAPALPVERAAQGEKP